MSRNDSDREAAAQWLALSDNLPLTTLITKLRADVESYERAAFASVEALVRSFGPLPGAYYTRIDSARESRDGLLFALPTLVVRRADPSHESMYERKFTFTDFDDTGRLVAPDDERLKFVRKVCWILRAHDMIGANSRGI